MDTHRTDIGLRLLIVLALACTVLFATAVPALAMQIFVDTPSNGILTLDVEPTDTIQNLKGKIHDQIAVDPAEQVLTFAGTVLEENRTLADYNIQKEATVVLTLGPSGPVGVPASSAWSLVMLGVLAVAGIGLRSAVRSADDARATWEPSS